MVVRSCVRAVASAVSSVFRPGVFNNKVAIVTGGGSGIGKAITQELIFLGCKVMIASRSEEKLHGTTKELQQWLEENGRDLSHIQYWKCNIRKEEEVQSLVSHTVSTFGQLDFLVNNGGGQFPCRAEDISLKGWNAVIETNLTGGFFMCKEAYNQWMKDHGGAIVNIIADMWRGFPMMAHTGAARSAMDNLTKTLALEWVHSGVRVNAVSLGIIYSKTAVANYEWNIFDEAAKGTPYRRVGSVEEVSSAVCFLLSPGAAFITGTSLQVEGGEALYTQPVFRIPAHSSMAPYTWDQEAS